MDTTQPQSDAVAQTYHAHLQIIGSMMEHVSFYQKPRQEAVSDIVVRVIASLPNRSGTKRAIRDVLCIGSTPLVEDKVLRNALDDLLSRKKVQVHQGVFKLVDPSGPASTDGILPQLKQIWDRDFSHCASCTIDDFSAVIALLFARYGCSAYSSLTDGAPEFATRIDVVLGAALPGRSAETVSEMRDILQVFITSHDPLYSRVKLRLATVYVILRMNGASNWNSKALDRLIRDKRLLLDTNLLFLHLGSGAGQLDDLLEALHSNGASFVVGSETLRELESALRGQAGVVKRFITKGVALRPLIDAGILRYEWLARFLASCSEPTVARIDTYVDEALADIDTWLSTIKVRSVHLDRGGDGDERKRKLEEIKAAFERVRPRTWSKTNSAANHDMLMWEALENGDQLADYIVGLDRSLRAIRIDNRRIALMFDELLTYSMLKSAPSDKIADLFSSVLSKDLIPDSEYLRADEIESLSNMEGNVLNAPPAVLRDLVKQLNTLHVKCAEEGRSVPADEVQRVAFHAIATHDHDRRNLQLEREQRLAIEASSQQLVQRLEVSEQQRTSETERLRRELEETRQRAAGSEEQLASLLERTTQSELLKPQIDAETTAQRERITALEDQLAAVAIREREREEMAEQEQIWSGRHWFRVRWVLFILVASLATGGTGVHRCGPWGILFGLPAACLVIELMFRVGRCNVSTQTWDAFNKWSMRWANWRSFVIGGVIFALALGVGGNYLTDWFKGDTQAWDYRFRGPTHSSNDAGTRQQLPVQQRDAH